MRLTRRSFLGSSTALTLSSWLIPGVSLMGATASPPPLEERIRGLLLGTLIGDAFGGPVEFQEPSRVARIKNPPKTWGPDEILDEANLKAAGQRVVFRSYKELRPIPESFAHWTTNAEPGTITDDSRHKIVLIDALRRADQSKAWPLSVEDLARVYLTWPDRESILSHPGYIELNNDWLREWRKASRWVLGDRTTPNALPPERIWSGLATCCGQMTMPPFAAIFPGQPERAYRSTYQLSFFDNGIGRDLNAALVAGLAQALVTHSNTAEPAKAWEPIFEAMRKTDPYEYSKVPWVKRPVDRWLDFALDAAARAERHPARLFAILEKEFQQTIKWEAQVPYVVVFAVLAICNYQPLAALQLSIEWGHDTDSYAQLLGAFLGALHGPGVFPAEMRAQVETRLKLDYNEDVASWVKVLISLQEKEQSTGK